jgi:hypothetical protein
VARLVGRNLWRGALTGGVLRVDGGGEIHCGAGSFDGPALVSARPSSVVLSASRPAGDNAWQGPVASLEVQGERSRVVVSCVPPVVAEVSSAELPTLRLGPGDRVWASIPPGALSAWAHS